MGELKVLVFFYVKSIEINRVKYLTQRRFRIKICGKDLHPDSKNLMENPVLV